MYTVVYCACSVFGGSASPNLHNFTRSQTLPWLYRERTLLSEVCIHSVAMEEPTQMVEQLEGSEEGASPITAHPVGYLRVCAQKELYETDWPIAQGQSNGDFIIAVGISHTITLIMTI